MAKRKAEVIEASGEIAEAAAEVMTGRKSNGRAPEPGPAERLAAAVAAPEPPKSEEREALDKIAAKEREVEEGYRKYELSKGQTAALKKAWENLVDQLQQTIRELTAPPLPLFDKPKAEARATAGDESWRREPLSALGLGAAILEKLAAKDIATVGQLADWTADGKRRIEDIPGIGPATADTIADALEAFWANRKPADTSWREVKLSAFGLDVGILDALASDGIETMGDLADHLYVLGHSFAELPLPSEGLDALASAVRRFWRERGGVGSSGFDLAWLDTPDPDEEAEAEEPSPEGASAPRTRRAKAGR